MNNLQIDFWRWKFINLHTFCDTQKQTPNQIAQEINGISSVSTAKSIAYRFLDCKNHVFNWKTAAIKSLNCVKMGEWSLINTFHRILWIHSLGRFNDYNEFRLWLGNHCRIELIHLARASICRFFSKFSCECVCGEFGQLLNKIIRMQRYDFVFVMQTVCNIIQSFHMHASVPIRAKQKIYLDFQKSILIRL